MREPTIARNYAEALVELARKVKDLRGFGIMADELSNAVSADKHLRVFLETPRVSIAEKVRIVGKAFDSTLPRPFVRFLQALIRNRRQMLLPEIAREYHTLVDVIEGRMHASVTIAREADDAERKMIADKLSKAIGKEVVPHFMVNPQILGGVVVRVGDTVLDGSVRRRLGKLRAAMVTHS